MTSSQYGCNHTLQIYNNFIDLPFLLLMDYAMDTHCQDCAFKNYSNAIQDVPNLNVKISRACGGSINQRKKIL